MSALKQACDVVGGASELARQLRAPFPSRVTNWLARGYPPAEQCQEIERITGIRCEDLRPDLDWTRDAAGRPYYAPRVAQSA